MILRSLWELDGENCNDFVTKLLHFIDKINMF